MKKTSDKEFSLQQLPKINEGSVIMATFTGRNWAIRGGFSYKKSEMHRATQEKRQPGAALKQ